MKAFGERPTVVATLRDEIHLLVTLLTHITRPDLACGRVDRKPPWVAQSDRPEFGADIGEAGGCDLAAIEIAIPLSSRAGCHIRVINRDAVASDELSGTRRFFITRDGVAWSESQPRCGWIRMGVGLKVAGLLVHVDTQQTRE